MIEILRTLNQFDVFRKNLRPGTIGFVPTMGNLHKGHMSLVKESLRHNDNTIVSIFVNPKQFGPSEDFEKYPRTLGRDNQTLKELYRQEEFKGKLLTIFAPENPEEVFPPGFSTKISVGDLTNKLCGINRPGHFDGVTTVVYRLFSIVKPHKAYFGQKDYQQYLVIKKMMEDLKLDIQLVPMPTKRDADGLALSSRNQYLNKDDKLVALSLPSTLESIKELIRNNYWPESYEKALNFASMTKESPAWDYLEILDAKTLEEPTERTHTIILAGALKVGRTRLIDNKLVEIKYAR
ncbi:MAG: pantoate--beta-alanine ligase [Bacteriovoracaceae bacterium]|jgi:pantoate--beta-alanine ligase